ncbi:MAG: PLP-dependent aminotransferase family protein [Clostridia bacterium]|nr:PLP-dependent aminotransferase family protein [Clostridia bacterium]
MLYDLNEKHKYYSLYKRIRQDVLSGKLKWGDKLPSKRALAQELSVSVITVQTAYEQLLAEGYVIAKERSGYFVAKVNVGPSAAEQALPEKKTDSKRSYKLDLVKGSAPANMFPFSVWAKLMRGVLSDCGEHLLERVPCDGDYELKSAICAYLYRARGIQTCPEYVIIGAGAEYLYGVIVQLLGRDNTFAVENPGYEKIASSYRLNGAKCTFVSVKNNGVDFNEVVNSNANVLHISPSHQFPTGAVTPAESRAELIAWAQAGRYIVEDDYDSEFRLSGKPLQCMQSLCPERVIYMNTFSKTLAPSMRMGYMVLPPKLYKKYMQIFGHSASVVPLFEQKTLAKFISEGYFERHINRLKNHYKGVRANLINLIEKRFSGVQIRDTGSGLHFTVTAKNAGSDEQIKKQAELVGVRIKCLSDYLQVPISGYSNTAVINYSGVTEEQLKNI